MSRIYYSNSGPQAKEKVFNMLMPTPAGAG